MHNPLLVRISVSVCAALVLLGGAYFAGRAGHDYTRYTNDFNVFYFAGRNVIGGGDPYERSISETTPYLYPPMLAELLIPLCLLRLSVAAYAWFLISVTALAAAGLMAAKLAVAAAEDWTYGRDGMPSLNVLALAAVGILVIGRFALDTFDMGQVNCVLAALVVGHVYLFANDKKLGSSLLLAAAIAIKLTPGIFLIYHVAKGRIRFVLTCVLLLVLIMTVSFSVFGDGAFSAFEVFVNRTILNGQGFDFSYVGNQSIRGLTARLFGASGESARMSISAESLAASAILIVLAVLAARAARKEAVGAAPFFCCSVLLSPLSWKGHFAMLLLPAVLIAGVATRSRPAIRTALLIALGLSGALFNLTSPKIIGIESANFLESNSVITVGALLLFSSSLATGLRDKSMAKPSEEVV